MELRDVFICSDVLEGMKLIPDNSVSLILTSPPYNVGIKYENYSDSMEYESYISWLKSVFHECYRVLKSGGRLVVNHDSTVNHESKEECYFRPLYADLCNINKDVGFKFFTDIAWYKQQVVGRATAWGSWMSCSTPIVRRNHEYLIVWSKESYTLIGDSEKSDMTKEEFENYTMSFWDIKPETKRDTGHPAPFPEELAKRVIKLYSYRDDLILDPFSGSGTTCYVAKMLHRNYIGIDNSERYIQIAKNRLLSIDDIFIDDNYVPRSERIKKNNTETH